MHHYVMPKRSFMVTESSDFMVVRTAMQAALLRDDLTAEERSAILERYFSDVYALLLHRLSSFALHPATDAEEVKQLHSLLDELIRTRTLMAEDIQA